MPLPEYIDEIAAFLRGNGVTAEPDAAVILGSGLGSFADEIDPSSALPYHSIPHCPSTSVEGHDGKLIWGTVNKKRIIAFSGRFHHYEGHDFQTTAMPVYIATILGAQKLIISNAAGAINTSFSVGDLMVIDDIFRPPRMIAPAERDRYRYDHYPHADRVREIGANLGLPLQRGTYLYVQGPNYETKAEIRAFRIMGADAVGMSTAPELMEASRLGLPAAGVSLITNMSTGITSKKLDHAEVEQAAESRKGDFAKLVKALIADW